MLRLYSNSNTSLIMTLEHQSPRYTRCQSHVWATITYLHLYVLTIVHLLHTHTIYCMLWLVCSNVLIWNGGNVRSCYTCRSSQGHSTQTESNYQIKISNQIWKTSIHVCMTHNSESGHNSSSYSSVKGWFLIQWSRSIGHHHVCWPIITTSVGHHYTCYTPRYPTQSHTFIQFN